MARPPWVAQIRNTKNTGDQILALRSLKNELIGHPVKKEAAVESGVLEAVVHLSTNRVAGRHDGKSHDHTFASESLTEEETVRLQGIHVIASIALGGPYFLASLHNASALPTILSNLCPVTNPSQLVLASLRALSNLAESCELAVDASLTKYTLAEHLFVKPHLSSLARILSQVSSSNNVQSQISLSATLISRLCQEERHQQILATSGVLDALATRLAGFIVAEGLVIPGAETLARRDGIEKHFPPAAPPNAKLSVILEAIAVVIRNSTYRASQLLFSYSLLSVLPVSWKVNPSDTRHNRDVWTTFESAGLGSPSAVDFLLPWLRIPEARSLAAQVTAFPPLGTSASGDNLAQAGKHTNDKSPPPWIDLGLDKPKYNPDAKTKLNMSENDSESPLIPYLIYILRSRAGIERLMAASVLTDLYRTGLANKSREMAIGLLVVPLLVQMMDDVVTSPRSNDSLADEEAIRLDWKIKETAPAVLAALITDSEYLQKAAFEGGVISKLSKMLKLSFDPVIDDTKSQIWSPEIENSEEISTSNPSDQGQSPLLVHKIKIRESTLRAIAALVPFRDEYRKAVIEQGVIPYIVESLSQTPGKPNSKAGDNPERTLHGSSNEAGKKGYGINPINVLIAACIATRALSRSVSVLRTTLIDYGVALPVFKLMTHEDLNLRIAATAAACNLLTDIAPMRETFAQAGVLRVLCEHARSTSAKMRLEAVWALQHLLLSSDNQMKTKILEELGEGWLIQLILDDTENDALSNSNGKEPAQSTLVEGDADEDVEMDQFDEELDTDMTASITRSISPNSNRSKFFQAAEEQLAKLRDLETNPATKARKSDLEVQEKALDFVRNMIGGGTQREEDTTEMIDFLFDALGQDRLFEILAHKLRTKTVRRQNPFTNATELRKIPPQPQIVISVIFILVHMAAGSPKHRQIVISQTPLLELLLPQFQNPATEVRIALCHLVTNLTWLDNDGDERAYAARAAELRKMGFQEKLEGLAGDPELDVRERSKSALFQIRNAGGSSFRGFEN